jgi:hypothetical protein
MARQPSIPKKAPAVTEAPDQDVADLEKELSAVNDAPTLDDDEAPDAVAEEESDDDDILIRMKHEVGVHHVNLHPLVPGTVISMKRGEFKGHQSRGMLAEVVGDDYDGEVYDVSQPWKPEVKESA